MHYQNTRLGPPPLPKHAIPVPRPTRLDFSRRPVEQIAEEVRLFVVFPVRSVA